MPFPADGRFVSVFIRKTLRGWVKKATAFSHPNSHPPIPLAPPSCSYLPDWELVRSKSLGVSPYLGMAKNGLRF